MRNVIASTTTRTMVAITAAPIAMTTPRMLTAAVFSACQGCPAPRADRASTATVTKAIATNAIAVVMNTGSRSTTGAVTLSRIIPQNATATNAHRTAVDCRCGRGLPSVIVAKSGEYTGTGLPHNQQNFAVTGSSARHAEQRGIATTVVVESGDIVAPRRRVVSSCQFIWLVLVAAHVHRGRGRCRHKTELRGRWAIRDACNIS